MKNELILVQLFHKKFAHKITNSDASQEMTMSSAKHLEFPWGRNFPQMDLQMRDQLLCRCISHLVYQ